MSYRTDTNATYDRALLSSVPDPTRAERQVRIVLYSTSFPSKFFSRLHIPVENWQSQSKLVVPLYPPSVSPRSLDV